MSTSSEIRMLSLKPVEDQMNYIEGYQNKRVDCDNIYLYGKLLLTNHRFKEAKKVLKLFLSEDPNRVNSLLCLSDIYRIQGKYEKSRNLLNRASKIDPKYDTTHYKIIKLLMEQGQTEVARKFFDQNNSILLPYNLEFFLTKAQLQIEEDQLSEAEESINFSIQMINTPYDTPFLLRSLIALKRGKLDEVKQNLDLAINHTSSRVPKIKEKLQKLKELLPTLNEVQIQQEIKQAMTLENYSIV